MHESELFRMLVLAGGTTGEVIAIDHCLVTVKGLLRSTVGSVVVFENGDQGIVRKVDHGVVVILNLTSESSVIGALCVIKSKNSDVLVGKGFLGRVVDVFGVPLDGLEAPNATATRPMFGAPPGIAEREVLKDQLYSGVSIVDMMFPIVKGQRIAILGDAKTGKTSFLEQVSAQQHGQEVVLVHVLVGKRRQDVDALVHNLKKNGVLDQSVIIFADMFGSLGQSYIAPYVGCAIAEFFWQVLGKDTVIFYDDLSAHAKVCREIGLLERANSGRDSYPADMFYTHASLLERAGKLKNNGKTLTALPVALAPAGDITTYLATSLMSITDGQIIFDMSAFRQNIRPAISTGLSVSRVGGRARNAYQQTLAGALSKKMAAYRQAQEFARFGSELAVEAQQTLITGAQLQDVFRQLPDELYSIVEQELLVQTILDVAGANKLDITKLKAAVRQVSAEVTSYEQHKELCARLATQAATSEASTA